MKLSLREVQASDLDAFFEHQQDEEACRMAAFTSKDPSDRVAFDAHWAKIMASESVVIRTIVIDDVVAGHVAKFVMDEQAELTYWIGRAFWGRGVATSALRSFLDDVYRSRPVYARCAADNTGSARVLRKCGFTESGRDRGFANARGEEISESVWVLRA